MPKTPQVCRDCGKTEPVVRFAKRHAACNTCRHLREQARVSVDWRAFFAIWLGHARSTRQSEVTVTPEQLIEMLVEQGGLCALSGKKLTRQSGDLAKASVDRLDTARGYDLDNVRLVAWAVNRMRNNMTDEVFQSWVTALANTRQRAHTVS